MNLFCIAGILKTARLFFGPRILEREGTKRQASNLEAPPGADKLSKATQSVEKIHVCLDVQPETCGEMIS